MAEQRDGVHLVGVRLRFRLRVRLRLRLRLRLWLRVRLRLRLKLRLKLRLRVRVRRDGAHLLVRREGGDGGDGGARPREQSSVERPTVLGDGEARIRGGCLTACYGLH